MRRQAVAHPPAPLPPPPPADSGQDGAPPQPAQQGKGVFTLLPPAVQRWLFKYDIPSLLLLNAAAAFWLGFPILALLLAVYGLFIMIIM